MSLSRMSYFHLASIPPVLFLSSLLSVPVDEASCYVVSCPIDAYTARNHKRSLGINSLRVEALSPTTCEELNPDITLVSEFGGRPSPVEL